jgi:hypothetical protein
LNSGPGFGGAICAAAQVAEMIATAKIIAAFFMEVHLRMIRRFAGDRILFAQCKRVNASAQLASA